MPNQDKMPTWHDDGINDDTEALKAMSEGRLVLNPDGEMLMQEYRILVPPDPEAYIRMTKNDPMKWSLGIYPNAWRRFWYWALLGWWIDRA